MSADGDDRKTCGWAMKTSIVRSLCVYSLIVDAVL